jgi:hypothetical protein
MDMASYLSLTPPSRRRRAAEITYSVADVRHSNRSVNSGDADLVKFRIIIRDFFEVNFCVDVLGAEHWVIREYQDWTSG